MLPGDNIKIIAFQETNYVNEWLGLLENHKVTAILAGTNPKLSNIKSYHSFPVKHVKALYVPYRMGGEKVSSTGMKDHILYTLFSIFTLPIAITNDAAVYITPSFFHTITIPVMKFFGKKVYLVVLDPQEVLRKNVEGKPLGRMYYRIAKYLEHAAIKKSDKVFAVSTYLWNSYRKINKNTYYVPNGADVAHISEIIPKKISAKPTITFFGSLDHWRGVDLLVAAFKKLEKKHAINLAILGGGKEEKTLRDMCKHWKNIHMSGFINHREAIAVCKASEILVIPYRDSPILYKTMPIKTFEYMACGVPIVVTDTGEHADIIKKMGCGLAVNPDSNSLARGIEKLLSDRKLYIKLKRNCMEKRSEVDYRKQRKAFRDEIAKDDEIMQRARQK